MLSTMDEALQYSEMSLFDCTESDVGFLADHFSRSCGEKITTDSLENVLGEIGPLNDPTNSIETIAFDEDAISYHEKSGFSQDSFTTMTDKEPTSKCQSKTSTTASTRGRKMSDKAFSKLSLKEQNRRLKNRLSAKKTRENRLNQIATLSQENSKLSIRNAELLNKVQELTEKVRQLECEKNMSLESNKLLQEKSQFQDNQIRFLTKMIEN